MVTIPGIGAEEGKDLGLRLGGPSVSWRTRSLRTGVVPSGTGVSRSVFQVKGSDSSRPWNPFTDDVHVTSIFTTEVLSLVSTDGGDGILSLIMVYGGSPDLSFC